MSVSLRILSSVYEDIAEAFLYYEGESKGLGVRFLENIDSIYENVVDFPLMYPVNFDDVHRALLTKFPYAIYYIYKPEEVTILAIRNTRRDPTALEEIISFS